MITKASTDDERTQELRNKILTVVAWDESKEMKLGNPDASVRQSIISHAKNLDIIGTKLNMEGIFEELRFNKKTIEESINQTIKNKGDLQDLAKLFTVLHKVAKNAVLMEVEEYRHTQREVSKNIEGMWQYISGFCDDNLFYPVKFTVEKRKIKKDSRVYMTITVGKITLPMGVKREALPDAGVTSGISGESLPNGTASFNISITDLVKYFNRYEGIIIKNLPDGILEEKQIAIKEKIKKTDIRREICNKKRGMEKKYSKTVHTTDVMYKLDDNVMNLVRRRGR